MGRADRPAPREIDLRRRAGQLSSPVLDFPIELRTSQSRTLNSREIGVLDRKIGELRPAAYGKSRIGIHHLTGQDLLGPAVRRQVMKNHQQQMIAHVQSQERSAIERPPLQIEGTSGVAGGPRQGPRQRIIRRLPGPIHPLDLWGLERQRLQHRLSTEPADPGTQHRVPSYDLSDRLLERNLVQRATEPQAQGRVICRIVWFQPVEEVELLLHPGKRGGLLVRCAVSGPSNHGYAGFRVPLPPLTSLDSMWNA